MKNSSVRPADVLENILDTYGNMLFRYSLLMLGTAEDAEDVVQETLLKYWKKAPEFKNKDHEKAWLLTVAANRCKDILRFRMRHPVVAIESLPEYRVEVGNEASDSGIMEALMVLPEKYKSVLYLYYVEEYRMEDIAGMIGRTSSAVKMRLKKGRQLLKDAYRKEYM
ncbi:MAG: sigma-70 family RNA polymerase sigma factor [Lachnospiraceae bacterium]|nr:sigma-70 family RNA polymerase sigma factor [Lachnospiraceae bacterium]